MDYYFSGYSGVRVLDAGIAFNLLEAGALLGFASVFFTVGLLRFR